MNLDREVAVITGASSGIGSAVAIELANLGMRVALLARRRDRLEALVAQIQSNGGEAYAYPVDLRDTSALEETLNKIHSEVGPTRALINNAGLGHSAPLTSGDTEHWREMLEVNVLALCVCTRESIKQMRAHGDWGQVIHISSMAGHRVPEGSGVYSATKFAVRALTEGLRKELRAQESPIRISSISPGFVETEFAAHYHRSEEKARDLYNQYEVLSAEDVARQVSFVLTQPPHVQIHDLLLRPTQQLS
jgi:NADP-dependent 3-hydroxy acid dehydrogenase YdfG